MGVAVRRPLSLLLLLAGVAWIFGSSCAEDSATLPVGTTNPGGNAGVSGAGGDPAVAGKAGSQAGGSKNEAGAAGASGKTNLAGNSGESGTGGTGEPSEDDPPAWVLDDSRWEPIAPPEGMTWGNCASYSLAKDLTDTEVFSWGDSCGEGCTQMNLKWGNIFPHASTTSTWNHGGKITTLYAGTWVWADHSVRRLIDLETGKTLIAFRGHAPGGPGSPSCSSTGRFFEESRFTQTFPKNKEGKSFFFDAWMHADTGKVDWAPPIPLVQSGLAYFFNDVGGGSEFLASGDGVKRIDFVTQKIEVIDSESLANIGSGEGDLAIWVDLSPGFGKERIRGWAPDGKGARTLAEGFPLPLFQVVLGPKYMAGRMLEDGIFSGSQQAEAVHFLASPRAYDASQAKISYSPGFKFPQPRHLGVGSTRGDYMLTATFYNDPPGVPAPWLMNWLITHIPSWKTYEIQLPPKAVHPDRGSNLSDTHLYLAVREGGVGLWDATLLRRYDFSKLPQWGSLLPTIP